MSKKILHYTLATLILLLPFSGVHFFVFGIPLYVPELLLIFACTVFLYISWHTYPKKLKVLPKSIFIAILLILTGLFSSSIASGLSTVSLGIMKSWFFFPIIFFWLLYQTLHETHLVSKTVPKPSQLHAQKSYLNKEIIAFLWYITLGCTSVVSIGYYIQNILTYDGRLKAFYLSPNQLALFIFPGIFLGVYFSTYAWHRREYMYSFISTALLIMISFALLATHSYTVIASSLAVLTLMNIRKIIDIVTNTKKKWLFFVIVISTWSISIIYPSLLHFIENFNRSSVASRLMIWQSSWKMVQNYPFLGIGPGNFQDTYLKYQIYFPPYLDWAVPHPHNLYLAFWLQAGLIGLIGFIVLISYCIILLYSRINNYSKTHTNPELAKAIQKTKKPPFLKMVVSILVATLLIGLLDTPVWKNDLAYEFWLLIVLAL